MVQKNVSTTLHVGMANQSGGVFLYLSQNNATTETTRAVGNPDFYVDGNLQSWSTRADVYNALFGFKVLLSALNGDYSGVNRISDRDALQCSSIIQEIIIYTSDQSSNRTGISDNINAFYSIY